MLGPRMAMQRQVLLESNDKLYGLIKITTKLFRRHQILQEYFNQASRNRNVFLAIVMKSLAI